FLGGIIPGVLIGLGMMTLIYILAVKRDYPRDARVEFKAFLKMLKGAIPALLTPIIISGVIITGFFTATEAAAIASLYTAFILMFYYRSCKWMDSTKILFDTLALSSISLFALAAAGALGELMSYYQLGSMAQEFFANNVGAAWLFILIIIVFFLLIGTFMGAIPAMILFVSVIFLTAIG